MLRLFFSHTLEAHALLREAVRLTWGWEELPRLEREERGKPWFPERPGYCFNLSHSGPYALCALGHAPVGADVEQVRPRRPFLPQRALSPEELRWFQALGGLLYPMDHEGGQGEVPGLRPGPFPRGDFGASACPRRYRDLGGPHLYLLCRAGLACRPVQPRRNSPFGSFPSFLRFF